MKKLTLLVMMLGLGFAVAADSPMTARQVMAKVIGNSKVTTAQSTTTMTLIDKQGQKIVRKYRLWQKKIKKGSKAMVKFIAPSADKDIGLLVDNDGSSAAKQWIFFPKLNETKRILGSDQKKPFMGSDFSYEDMQQRKLDDAKYTMVSPSKAFKGRDCYVIESTPKSKTGSGYSKIKSWVDRENYVVLKSIFFIKGKLAKVLYQKELEKISGVWTPRRVEMRTLAAKHTTVLQINKVAYNKTLAGSFFTNRFLKRRL